MKIVEFWILESVVDEGDWDCSMLKIFRSYESVTDYVRKTLGEYETVPVFVQADDDGYFRTLVYDAEDSKDPWYIIHKGSITEEST